MSNKIHDFVASSNDIMIKHYLFLVFFLFLSSQIIGQYSDDPLLEKDIAQIWFLLNKGDAEKESQEIKSNLYEQAIKKSYETLEKHELSCDQKGRIFLKIGLAYWNDYKDNEAIHILKDSTLGYWIDCPGLEQRWLWDPAVLLFDLYILNNRLLDAEKIFQYIESKPLITEGVSPWSIQQYYASLGVFAAEINDKTLSIQSFKKAVNQLDEIKDPSLNFDVHHNFANSLARLGDPSNSIIQYEKALKYAETEEDKISVIVNYTDILIQNDGIQKADSLLNFISKFISKHNDFYRYKMIYLQRKATIKNKQGEYLEAISFMNEALDEIKDKEDALVSRAVNLSKMASSYYGMKDYPTGDKKVTEAINILLATNENVDILKGESATSHISYNFRELFSILENLVVEKLNMENLDGAIFILIEIQKLIDHNKQKLSGESSKIFQTSSIYPLYEKAIDKLISEYNKSSKEAFLDQAIQLSLTNKGNILNNIISENQIYENELPEVEYNRFKILEFNKKSAESNVVNASSKNLDSLNNEYFLALSAHNQFQDSLLQIHSDLQPKLLKNSMDLNVQDIENYLGGDQAYLEIFAGQNNLYLFCITSKDKTVFTVPLTDSIRNQFDQYITELYEYTALSDFYVRSQNFYNLLYKNPFEFFNKLGTKNIITSSDGIFHMVPVETFWNGQTFLVEDFDISYVLSNNQLKTEKDKYSQDYLGFGSAYSTLLNEHISNTTGRPNLGLSHLQLAEKEIENGTQILGGDVYLGKDATKHKFLKSSPTNSGIIHLALHGIILNKNKSGILFYDEESDFILDQLELGLLKLKNKLTILSACHSGSGEVYTGEGIRSLARSFLYAGSNSVVSSLWAASDISNEEIMTSFLENISNGYETHESLSQAKRDYLQNASPYARHPSYWGNMVFIGTYESASPPYLWYFILSLVVISLFLIIYRLKK